VSQEQKPSVGRIVLYRTAGGFDFAAIIEAVENPDWMAPLPEGNVHLRVFVPFPHFGVFEHASAELGTPFDQLPPADRILPGERSEPKPGHWRWPERV
jgi:hypothetical protein